VGLGFVVGVALLGVVLMGIDWAKMRAVLADSEPLYLLPIGATLLVHYVFKGLRWRVLLSTRAPVPRGLAIRLTFVGFFMNHLFPARMGELGRPYLLSRHIPDVPFTFALATLFGDKLFDLAFVALCLAVSFAVLPLPASVVQAMAVTTGICCVILAVGIAAAWWHDRELGRDGGDSLLRRLTRRLGRFGDRVYQTLLTFAEGLSAVSSLRRLAAASAHATVSFLFLVGTTWCCLEMVGIDADVRTCLFAMGLIGVSFMIPAPPTNAGNMHFFATVAVVLAGAADLERAFAFAVVTHLSQVVSVSAAGILSLVGLDWRQLWKLNR